MEAASGIVACHCSVCCVPLPCGFLPSESDRAVRRVPTGGQFDRGFLPSERPFSTAAYWFLRCGVSRMSRIAGA